MLPAEPTFSNTLTGPRSSFSVEATRHSLKLRSISDDELLSRLSELLRQSRRVEAELIAHIGEVDARELYRREACSSMFVYCIEVLHLSEAESYLRINVARATRKDPELLQMLADGRLHLSGIERLAPRLTKDNRRKLLARATHQSKRRIEELVAEFAPRPDVPPTIRKLAEPRHGMKATRTPARELRPDGVEPGPVVLPDGVQPAPAAVRPPVVQPLSPGRYEVKFTAGAELRAKLERPQALMRSSQPQADLAQVIEAAVTEKLERLEARRFGQTKAPRKAVAKTDEAPSSRYIPAAVKREVWRRDGGRCRFVNEQGKRCTERHRLEFHHDQPHGRLGDRSPSNLMLMCAVHNQYLAERAYGREKMRWYRRPRDRPTAQVGAPGYS